MTQESRPHAFILLGPPGSGKSTQAEYFKRDFGAAHIDMGAALRRASAESTPFGETLNEIINKRQELVPDGIVRAVLEGELRKTGSDQLVVIDGAPRRESQIKDTISALVSSGKSFKKAIFIELSEDESIRRISCRFACARCGEKLILGSDIARESSPCPRCGGEIARRPDDTPDGIRTRWRVFHQETVPVLEHFNRKGLLLRVSGEQEASEIFRDICSKL